ncbi:ABC transporter substrate-binding protein [Microbacterium sp. NPDC055903]
MTKAFRRPLVVTAAAALLAAGLTSCTSAPQEAPAAECTPSDGPVTLTYWSWSSQAQNFVDTFNASHPDIQVDLKVVSGDTAYQNLFNALKAGTAPDLAMVEYQALPNVRLQDGLEDVSACDPVSDLSDRIYPWTYEQVSLGTDALYAAPVDTAPLALFYRTDVFEAAGLDAPTTWEEYREVAQQLDTSGVPVASFAPGDMNLLLSLMWQAGAAPFQYEGDTFTFDMTDEAAVTVADYWQGLIDDGLVNTSLEPFSPDQFKAWNDGAIATIVGPVWMSRVLATNAPDSAGKWAVAPLPQWDAGAPASANMGGSSAAVIAGTEHPYEAAVFLDWISSSAEAAPIVYQAGGLPASDLDGDDEQLSAPNPFYAEQPILEVFTESSAIVGTNWNWAPNITNVTQYMKDALAEAMGGGGTLTDALAATQERAADDLRDQGVDVAVVGG